MLNQLTTDLYINGAFSCKTFTPPASSVGNAAIPASAGLSASKLEHRHEKCYGQPGGAISFTEKRAIHVVYGATATLLAFRAGLITANVGAATVTFDLKKNGTTMLTAVINQTSAQAAYALTAAALASTTLVQGDVLEVVIVATAGGGTLGNGAFADLVLNEDAQ